MQGVHPGVHRLTNRTGSFQRVEPFDPARRSLVFKTVLNDALLVGEELTAALQGLQYLQGALLRQLVPRSGFLDLGNPDLPRPGLLFGPHANAYALDSGRDGVPLTLVAAGHLLCLGGAATDGADPFGFLGNNDRYCTITLPPAPATGGRDDLVFVEWWYAELDDGDVCHPWGCVQYLGDPLTNDLLNPAYSTSLDHKDVVIRWRLRVVPGVDLAGHPWGLSDPAVIAQADGASTFPFANLEPVDCDCGLWRAGDGSDDARAQLGATDGHTYAVPLQRVHRRNSSPFDLANPNGAGAALGGSTDRPDGRFHDQVHPADVQDLRLRTGFGQRNWSQLTARYGRQVFHNTLRNGFQPSQQPGHQDVAGCPLLQVDGISAVSDAGVQAVEVPDGVRRVFSDEAGVQVTVGFLSTGADDADLGGALSYTHATRTVSLSAGFAVEGARIAPTTPVLRWVDDGATVALSGSWAGLDSPSAAAVLDDGDVGYSSAGQFVVEFGLWLPGNHGLSHLPVQVHASSFNGTAMVLASDPAGLSLANLPQVGDLGVALRIRTRGIVEIARHEQITATPSGVALASGRVLQAANGSADGALVTGLDSGQTVDVIVAVTPQPTDKVFVYYDHVPHQSPQLPATLGLEVLHVEDRLHVSNLGTGGGTPGVPYLNPLSQIPDPSPGPGDAALANAAPLGNVLLEVNTGLLTFPVLLNSPADLIRQLSQPGTDAEGRRFYGDSDLPFVAIATPITTQPQPHRSALFGIARVTAGEGLLATGTLVLLCFTHTTDAMDLRAGVQGGSDMAVAVFPLFEV